jgi:hypothetical protein
MKTTLKSIVSFNPSNDFMFKLIRGYYNFDIDYNNLSEDHKNEEIDLKSILDNNGVEDTFWVLRTQSANINMLISADVAESVLYIYEDKYPNDKSIRNCINGIRQYCNGEISKEELSRLREIVVDFARIAASDSPIYSSVADSAFFAASIFSSNSISYSAAYSAAYAANHFEQNTYDQWQKNEEILKKYL